MNCSASEGPVLQQVVPPTTVVVSDNTIQGYDISINSSGQASGSMSMSFGGMTSTVTYTFSSTRDASGTAHVSIEAGSGVSGMSDCFMSMTSSRN